MDDLELFEGEVNALFDAVADKNRLKEILLCAQEDYKNRKETKQFLETLLEKDI